MTTVVMPSHRRTRRVRVRLSSRGWSPATATSRLQVRAQMHHGVLTELEKQTL